jgi:hypothetical protein
MVNTDYCKREIAEIVDVENEHLSEDDKHAVLHRNAERFYGLKPLGRFIWGLWCELFSHLRQEATFLETAHGAAGD